MLDRAVVRLISSGTLVEEAFLTPRQSNFLCSLSSSPNNTHYGFSVIDISTGVVAIHNVEESHLSSLLARYDPHEMLISSHLQDHLPPSVRNFIRANNPGILDAPDSPSDSPSCMLSIVDDSCWDDSGLASLILQHSELSILQQPLSRGSFSSMEKQSLSALLAYVGTMQMGRYPRLFFTETEIGATLELDKNTRDSLNLTRGYHNSALGSVLHVPSPHPAHAVDARPHGHRDGQPLSPQPPVLAAHQPRGHQRPAGRARVASV